LLSVEALSESNIDTSGKLYAIPNENILEGFTRIGKFQREREKQ
jgi:hypothetical protein